VKLLLLRRLLVVLLSAVIGGCVADRLHREGMNELNQGEFEDGLTKLAAAVKSDPNNLTYRLDFRARKEAAVQQLISAGDSAHAAGKPDEAQDNYRRVLVIEPGNDRARRGLDGVEADRRHAVRTANAEQLLKGRQFDLAEGEVRRVLGEDPGYAPANSLAAKIDAAKGPVTAIPRLRTQDNRPVTLQFRDAPTKMVFEVLARQTGINFIFDKDVKSEGKTTIFVNQVSVEQAIDLILTQNQLARQVLSENMVLVYPNTPAKQKDYQDEIVHTFYLTNAAPKDAESMLKTVLGSKTMYVDERSSEITIRDTPEHVRMAEKLIASLDVPEAEVLMEVEVLEITRSVADQLGINYPSHVAFSATSIASPGSTALKLADIGKQNSNTITVSSLGVSVDLLKTVGLTNVLSSPRIRAKNKEKARVLVGNRVPVVTSGSSATTGGTYSTSSVQYIDVGLTLDVQPTIHLDSNVAIKVGLEVSSILKEIDVPIGNGGTTIAYQIGTRNVSTLLELKDGETQVLAGLIQDSDQRNSTHLPGLGDLPLLGRLFGSTGTTRDKSEIVLSITPHIIRAQSRPTSESMEFWYGTETQSRSAPFSSTAPMESAGPAASLTPGGVSYGSGGAANAPTSAMRAAPTRIDASAGAPAPSLPSVAPPVDAPQAAATAPVANAPAGVVPTDTKKSGPGSGEGVSTPAAVLPPPASDAPPKVSIEGPDTAKVGDEINVAVRLASGTAPGRLRTQVRFDATALQLVSAEPGDLASSSDSPKVDVRAGGVQLELAGTSDARLGTTGSIVNLKFRAVAPRPAILVSTQVVMLGEDGAAMAATPAMPLKIAITP
jgi:general secretion pathway protein D